MALFPCDVGAHRYPGRSQSIYLAVLNGGHSYRRKFRLCQQHFVKLHDEIKRCFAPAQDELFEGRGPTCPQCGDQVESGNAAAFATLYAMGMDRADWWAPAHETCVPALSARWGAEPEPPAMAPERLTRPQ